MSSRPPLGTTSKICQKSPPRTTVFPPKIFSVASILLPRSNKDAIPEEAIVSMILPCPRRRDKSVVQTNVLPVPPLPYTKNSLPSLFVTTFKIVLYALR
ncbi:hypothetical protein BDL97_05G140700 [Sphagnum fallax]|nr:hypothetical protein BDL97_05G140700 [Sphagnum fallax]